MLDEAALRRDTFVATIEQHDELGSTSDRALELCRGGLPALPALVYAERQTAGRGRQGKSWWSAEGGLTFSLVVDPRSLGLAEEHQSAVAFRVGVAVTRALAETWPPRQNRPAMDCWVKWPNDVCVGWRKVAGVLVEAPVAPCGTRPLVIGVGINLNNLSPDAPLELQTRVASVQELVGRRVTPAERGQLLAGLISGIERQLRDIAAREPGELNAGSRSPFDGRRVTLQTPLGKVFGEYRGVDDDGALLLLIDGRVERIVSGSELRLADGADS